MKTTDEITLFREARPEVPDYDAAARARLRARLAGGGAAPGRAMMPRRRLVLAGALAAVVAAGGGGAVLLHGGDGGSGGGARLHLRTVASAQDLADGAARSAARAPDGRPAPHQWMYVKSVYAPTQEAGGKPLFGKPSHLKTRELWRRADDRRFAVVEGGRLKVVNGSKTIPHGPLRLDYPTLLALPTAPGPLLAHVYAVVDKESAEHGPRVVVKHGEKVQVPGAAPPTAEQRNARAFEIVTLYMRDAALPPRLRAAMYGALAKIPGVRYKAGASDLAGRPGVTLYRLQDGYLRGEVFVDPKTYAYLGFRFIAVRDHAAGAGELAVTKGQVTGWGSVVSAGEVRGPGARS